MSGAGIEDGDIVYLRKAPWAEYNGQIVAALINDQEDGVLKRIKWTEGSSSIFLVPENTDYQTKELFPNEIKISGLYMGHFKPCVD
ncbi:LexA repressor [compost metagenome]